MSRELDVRIAQVLGQEKPPTWGEVSYDWRAAKEPGTYEGQEWLDARAYRAVSWPPLYSTNIVAAWELFEQLGPAWCVSQSDVMGWDDDARWWCFLPVEFGGTGEEFKGATAPEAICKAWLAWKEADDG